MSKVILILSIFYVLAAAAVSAIKIPLIGTDSALFDKFERTFNMKFGNASERSKRREVFIKNLAKIKLLNLAHPETEYGINEYSAMTPEEFQNRLMPADWEKNFGKFNFTAAPESEGVTGKRQKRATPPTNFDWRTYQKVTAVRNQGSCGCCWAFASVAAIETQYAINYGSLIALSEQQLLDCNTVNSGCNGGYPYYSMQYAIQNGLKLQQYYGYQGVQYSCRASAASGSSYYLRSFTQLSTDENYLVNYLYNYGPVTMCFTFPSSMQYYSSGVINLSQSQCEAQKSGAHAVTIIGFGTDSSGVPFFTAKNSWGLNWGENGFFRFRRNVNFCNFSANLVAAIF